MTSEATAFDLLRAKVCWPKERMERIENGLLPGMPDVNYCLASTEGWIEIKSPTEPKRPDTALFGSNHPVGVDQANWFLKQRLAGGRAFLYIATNRRLILMDGRDVGEAGIAMNKWPVSLLIARSAWFSPLENVGWDGLRAVLIG
jgi:hypothetical protein